MNYVWKKIRILRGCKQKIDWNIWQKKDRIQEIEKEIEKIVPAWTNEERITRKENEEEETKLEKEITRQELERALKRVKVTSAPGTDGVEYIGCLRT